VDGSRIRTEKVADSKISGYVWTGPYMKVENAKSVNKTRLKGSFLEHFKEVQEQFDGRNTFLETSQKMH